MRRRLLITVLLFILLSVSAAAVEGVTVEPEWMIKQPGNNVDINIIETFDVAQLVAYEDTTRIDYSNFTVTGSTTDQVTVNLSWYNRTAAAGEYAANFTADTVDGNNVNFSLELVADRPYLVERDGDFHSYSTGNANALLWFTANQWSSHQFTVKQENDTTPPTSSDNWTATDWMQQSKTTIELTCSDTTTNCSALSYRVDSGAWTTVDSDSTTVSLSTDGNHSLKYNGTDSAGNVESTNMVYVASDATPPTSTDDWSYTSYQNLASTDITLTATDTVSKVDRISYRIDNGDWTTEDGARVTTTIRSNGNHTVEYKATDTAGNVEPANTVYVALNSVSSSDDQCPDQDGDLVCDADDRCPDVPGSVDHNGCLPEEKCGDGVDNDGDGFVDEFCLLVELRERPGVETITGSVAGFGAGIAALWTHPLDVVQWFNVVSATVVGGFLFLLVYKVLALLFPAAYPVVEFGFQVGVAVVAGIVAAALIYEVVPVLWRGVVAAVVAAYVYWS